MFRFLRAVTRIVFYPFFRVKVIGNRRIKNGSLIISNHISMADPILILCAARGEANIMAKKELFSSKLGNWFFRSINCFPVDRQGADISAIRNAVDLLKHDKSLLIFPQGTRMTGKKCEKNDIKGGIGIIALHTGVDIVPVSVYNKEYRISFLRKTLIVFGNPITKDEYITASGGDKTLLAEYCFDKVIKQLDVAEKTEVF